MYIVDLGESPLTLLGVPGPELWIELPVPRVLPRRDFGESSRSSEKVMLIPYKTSMIDMHLTTHLPHSPQK